MEKACQTKLFICITSQEQCKTEAIVCNTNENQVLQLKIWYDEFIVLFTSFLLCLLKLCPVLHLIAHALQHCIVVITRVIFFFTRVIYFFTRVK
jgi:hypothetical protein